jgi:hypothetical protein
MKPKQPTAEEVWREIEKALSKIDGLIERLPADERPRLREQFENVAVEHLSRWMATLVQGMSEQEIAAICIRAAASLGCNFTNLAFYRLKDITHEAAQRVKDQLTVKPRMTARDDEVVRLRDQDKLPWKEIMMRIRSNPDWAAGQGGRPVTAKALCAAYIRRKKPSAAKVEPPFAQSADGNLQLPQMHLWQESGKGSLPASA